MITIFNIDRNSATSKDRQDIKGKVNNDNINVRFLVSYGPWEGDDGG